MNHIDSHHLSPAIRDVVEAAVRALQRPPETQSPWLTKKAAAQRLGVCTATIERAARQGRLRVYRLNGGRHARYHVDDIDAYMRTFACID